MRKKKVWRYYCEFCKKSGCSGGHLKRHEERCTMNPGRVCGVCRMLDEEQGSIAPLVELLPDPEDYAMADEDGHVFYTGLDTAANAALPALREAANDCPVCIFAAIRQAGLPAECVSDFRWKEEMAAIWTSINDREAREDMTAF